MSTNTSPISLHESFGRSAATEADGKSSFLDRLFARFLNARMVAGEQRARQHLKSLSPEMLAGFGLTPEEVAFVQRTGKLPASYWSH